MGEYIERRGSLPRGRGSDVLAPGPSEIPPNTVVPVQTAPDTPPTLPDPGQDRDPSTKWAGRDPKTGKVIPHPKRLEKIAKVVAMHAASGLTKNQIACILNIRPGHLELHYYRELHNGLSQTVADVAGAMIGRAKSKSLNPVAQRAGEFILQARAGWRTGDKKEQTDVPMLNIVIHS